MRKQKVLTYLLYSAAGTLISLGFLLLFAAFWFTRSFGAAVGFDAILFTLFSDMHGTDLSAVYSYLLYGLLPAVLCSGALITAMVYILPYLLRKKLTTPTKQKLYKGLSLGLSAVLFFSTLAFAVHRIGLLPYFKNRFESTTLFDDHYVNPNDVEITFPEEKRNLIFIFLESMEISYADYDNGGALAENRIPNLTGLAKGNINFSHRDGLGGGQATMGATWTVAATIAATSGVPLCLPDDIWENGLNRYSKVMPGLTTLSDILHENGYNQAMMMGSDSEFAGQGKYYTQHMTDAVYDYNTALKENFLPYEDYHDGFWGMEDHYLFDYAKEKLTTLSQSDKPFALTLFTIDTHSPSGNICIFCKPRRTPGLNSQAANHEKYEDVITCSDRMVEKFLDWLSTQEFYENTTVILMGDHNSMNVAYFSDLVSPDYVRRQYNCIINSPIRPIREKNREFTSLDMFPTTLAALGCTIEGDRLGLGVNLFSDKDTLCETFGIGKLNVEINKTSPYYNKNFLFTMRDDQ